MRPSPHTSLPATVIPPSETTMAPATSTLRELLAPTCLAETDLLALDLAGIPRHQASGRQGRFQGLVEVDQGAGDAMTHGAGLT